MSEVLLFHHAQGLTPGVTAFADTLRAAGHTVHTPDLYEGNVFATLDEGLAYMRSVGFAGILERGEAAALGLPTGLVYAGFSMGVVPAQSLTQTRPGAKGALFYSASIPVAEFEGGWPAGVPLQIHGMDADPEFADSGDLEVAQEIAATVPTAELFIYPGSAHLFADSSLADYDAEAAALLTERTLEFLAAIDRA